MFSLKNKMWGQNRVFPLPLWEREHAKLLANCPEIKRVYCVAIESSNRRRL